MALSSKVKNKIGMLSTPRSCLSVTEWWRMPKNDNRASLAWD
jgi:hypothetical protein